MKAFRSGAAARGDWGAEALAGILILAAFVCGGGPRGIGDAVVTLLALPALFTVCARRAWSWHRLSSAQCAMGLLLVVLGVWHIAQLIPLPRGWFVRLPMRSQVLADLSTGGVAPAWIPATLDYWGTIRSLHALIVFGVTWGLLSSLSAASRSRLLKFCVALGCAMAVLGYAQAAAGQYSAIRPYAYHHAVGALGTFANRNHLACLMAMLVPVAVAFSVEGRQSGRALEAALWCAAAFMLLLAAALSFSRAGLVLSILSAVAAIVLLSKRSKDWLGSVAFAVATIATASVYAWHGIHARLQQDPLEDLRWQYLRNSWAAAKAYFPWGSGPGTFPFAYAQFEPVTQMQAVFALHAHNELLEILVESAVVGVLALAGFVSVLLSSLRKELIVANRRPTVLFASAIAVAVPMLHSLVDYPLRTYAVATLFALVLANVVTGRDPGDKAN